MCHHDLPDSWQWFSLFGLPSGPESFPGEQAPVIPYSQAASSESDGGQGAKQQGRDGGPASQGRCTQPCGTQHLQAVNLLTARSAKIASTLSCSDGVSSTSMLIA